MSKLVGQIMELFTQYLSLVGLLSDFFFLFYFQVPKNKCSYFKRKAIVFKNKRCSLTRHHSAELREKASSHL